jgi:hypothetical protein
MMEAELTSERSTARILHGATSQKALIKIHIVFVC